ncbi:MAG: PhzF family phenazine biosynthesis protein [Bacteroidota bacterium]|nr:PhzF family phenazine biosynthesis protein [Bacteroidota bacterium]MDP4232736.1 PhzF family phenazine biosynthesis protein [Bacteroidota bacterium]MDP4244052.1 PhzF family phenazine biosynthesis protein [Bacteroidota bacterium]MDP4287588.1 PhzF family phenazine biosynthesis protein [Bacteroidota bacterium]
MSVPIYQVDAFASAPFAGNPAAVCLLDGPREDAWMQNVATEMNLSETAFLTHRSPNRFDLRWMTPEVEVDLCGHATLASAHILLELGLVDPRKSITFITRSGPLSASIADAKSGIIELNFPATPASPVIEPPLELADAINRKILYIGRNSYDYLVELTSEENVRKLRPNMNLLRKLEVRGIVITAAATEGKPYNFVSRAFYPRAGIAEDPVTGSAHCMLGPYWSPRFGKTDLTGYQASKRGGLVRLQVDGDRVRLYGQAVTISKGELLV